MSETLPKRRKSMKLPQIFQTTLIILILVLVLSVCAQVTSASGEKDFLTAGQPAWSYVTIPLVDNLIKFSEITGLNFTPPPLVAQSSGYQTPVNTISSATQSQIKDAASFPYSHDKKIIEFGCDAPSPQWIKNNIASMEQRPFDGLAFWSGDWSVSMFLPIEWSKIPSALDSANLSAITWNKFKGNNFLILQTWTYDNSTNYWDDAYWATIEENMADLAKAARDSNCAGILLDTEWYSTKSPWSYANMSYGHTLADTQAKIRVRGAQVMNAWQTQYPNITILTTYLVEPAYWGDEEWELLPYWVNGMLDVIGPEARLVQSDEDAYYYDDTSVWFNRYDELKVSKSALDYLDPANERKWANNVEVGKTM